MCIDLHLHSLFSDGTTSPRELVQQGVRHGLSAMSLTDHDTVEGNAEMLHWGCEAGMTILTGLEISSVHRDTSLHILGYGIEPDDPELISWLKRLQLGRNERNEKILDRLRGFGFEVNSDDLHRVSPLGQAGRPHIARLLVERGFVDSVGQAFNLYLRRDAAAWADRFAYSAAESIDMIHRAGGIAVFAHPGQLDPEFKTLPLLIHQLVERGLDGLEVYYPSQSSSVRHRLLQLARKYNLVVTGGSDYHGKNRSVSQMAGANTGFCPPDSILADLTALCATRAANL